MPDLDHILRAHFAGGPPPPPEVLAMFDRKLRNTKLTTWVFLAVSVAMIAGGGIMLLQGEAVRDQLAGAVLIVLGGQVQMLVKLWFWQVHTRIQLQRDLRELLLPDQA